MRRQVPTLTIMLSTIDGGKTWKGSATSLFGQVSRIRWAESPKLLLLEFQDNFQWPSEVHAFVKGASTTSRVFAQKDRLVTDLIKAGGVTYLAAIEPPGQLVHPSIPGKVHVLRSADLAKWEEMEVDYRAVGNRAVLAASGGDLWVAVDSGMILKLVP
jgi:hypothetical protein